MIDSALVNKNSGAEIVLDGVRYALIRHQDRLWRMGSVNPAWRAELGGLEANPGPESLEALARRGIWLAPERKPAPAAIMCCGLGSVWPGMGRELYANFPAARLAMDRIASLADWDILGLLEESRPEKISGTRLQIPYLFMLEYAQWSQLLSLGFKPVMASGHSIGELVALCVAGVYSLESAWQLFDVRARHMADLERRFDRKTGMLGVSAEYEQIASILEHWQSVRISNINTRRQYVLSGPREDLLAIRKSLRQQRIPAFMLNMGMAFHNPHMRVMRDLSRRMLNALDMSAPAIPALSCVTGAFYPQDQDAICRQITDLDENAVDWTKSVQVMRSGRGIDCFVELGPQETLCGLTSEIAADCLCLAASRKNHEVEAMRELCARLFALGQLSPARMTMRGLLRAKGDPAFVAKSAAAPQSSAAPAESGGETAAILALVADLAGRKVSELRLDQDLRYDLALRSSSFPLLVQEAEKRLGRSVAMENMFQVSTLGDLVRFLRGQAEDLPAPAAESGKDLFAAGFYRWPALMRFQAREDAGGHRAPALLDPSRGNWPLRKDELLACCVFDPEILPDLLRGLAYFHCRLAIPEPFMAQCRDLAAGGCRLLPLPGADDPGEALAALEREHGRPGGIILAAGAETPRLLEGACRYAMRGGTWLIALERFSGGTEAAAVRKFFDQADNLAKFSAFRAIAWLDGRNNPVLQNPFDAGDMLALEIFFGQGRAIVWDAIDNRDQPRYCPASSFFAAVFPDRNPPLDPASGIFQGECQFSGFAEPDLLDHGPAGSSRLPLSGIVHALLETSRASLPWLQASGLENLRVFAWPELRPGITRECRVSARPLFWMPQDGAMSRLCRISMSLRQLGRTGRHTGDFLPLADCSCQMTTGLGHIARLWQPGAAHADPSPDCLDIFYDVLGYGPQWRLLRDFCLPQIAEADKNNLYVSYIDIMAIAADKNWSYKNISYMVEGIYQAALLALALGAAPADGMAGRIRENLASWNFYGIGFARFVNSCEPPRKSLRLELRKSWHDESLARFDAQLADENGSPLLTVNHLEFNRPGRSL